MYNYTCMILTISISRTALEILYFNIKKKHSLKQFIIACVSAKDILALSEEKLKK